MRITPDYRGKFLRNIGGKSAPLGQHQKYSTYIEPSTTYMELYGKLGVAGQGQMTGGGKDAFYPKNQTYLAVGSSRLRTNYLNQKSGARMPLEISSTADETRPDNVSVRHLIRAKN